MCNCLHVYGSSVSLFDSYLVLLVVHLNGWGVGHLFLQLFAFTRHDCLLSGSLQGGLLCAWILNSLLDSFIMHLLYEGAVQIYSLVPCV